VFFVSFWFQPYPTKINLNIIVSLLPYGKFSWIMVDFIVQS
jgi:hypothetical protein